MCEKIINDGVDTYIRHKYTHISVYIQYNATPTHSHIYLHTHLCSFSLQTEEAPPTFLPFVLTDMHGVRTYGCALRISEGACVDSLQIYIYLYIVFCNIQYHPSIHSPSHSTPPTHQRWTPSPTPPTPGGASPRPSPGTIKQPPPP